MKNITWLKSLIATSVLLGICDAAFSQSGGALNVTQIVTAGSVPPLYYSLSGISGEAAKVIQFDLYVQGFALTNAEGAQFAISGSSEGNLQVKVMDKVNPQPLVSKAYAGANLRRQAHAFVDDFMIRLERKPICQTKIAFRGDVGPGVGEIYVADFDGESAQAVTQDKSLVVAPNWIRGQLALYYSSYRLNHPDIFYHNLSTGSRKVFARYGGSNMSPAPSPDGSKVAMILSKDGWTDLYVCNSDGSGLLRLTKSKEDESSPCWSPDGKWICYAGKEQERRRLFKVSPFGGAHQSINTSGMPNPTEPDWSPDGKLIAFTSQSRDFSICVTPAEGPGTATKLVDGEDPSWATNSRTLIYTRRAGGKLALSLLDVPTKQVKNVLQSSGSSSQSQPSWNR
jgi:TolB protein